MLDKIIEQKKNEVKALKEKETIAGFANIITSLPATRDFIKAISSLEKINVIAEVKKASPSKGVIVENFNPVKIAAAYTEKGAAALSVLTDEQFFQGRKEYINEIKKVSKLPILRKDFIIDELQIFESRAIGADAILLIAAVLTKDQLDTFMEIAASLGLACLVEVHNKEELAKVLQTKANIIGINNRNLKDFSVDLNTTLSLLKNIPEGKIIVGESGYFTKEDIPAGVNAVLIGEGLTKNPDII
jgi:indole-3-glycerol phosphate synthase